MAYKGFSFVLVLAMWYLNVLRNNLWNRGKNKVQFHKIYDHIVIKFTLINCLKKSLTHHHHHCRQMNSSSTTQDGFYIIGNFLIEKLYYGPFKVVSFLLRMLYITSNLKQINYKLPYLTSIFKIKYSIMYNSSMLLKWNLDLYLIPISNEIIPRY